MRPNALERIIRFVVCPRCRLINPPGGMVCDCGYNFATGVVDPVKRESKKASWRDTDNFKKAYWPDIYDKESARNAKLQGVGAAGFCSVLTAVFAVLGHFNVIKLITLSSLSDAVIFALVAVGIYRSWRSAAVGGLIFYLLERIVAWSEYGFKNPWMALIISMAFVNSIRGTYWLASDRKAQQASAPANSSQD